ncbi:hypothetical protein ABIA35_008255 [Catenulispora sp. MAP12-49]|uniref:hypothetical protein n=1 Tax=unclassified Catenulispora TaxID=414885 RepID=UPI003510D312
MATAAFIIIGIIAPIVYGLERNERRQAGPRPQLSGSGATQDRDLERTWHDISASRRV